MLRTVLWLLPLLFIVLGTGCAKKPLPETVPEPMTEAYLLEHMKVTRQPDGLLNIVPPSRLASATFLGEPAKITTTLTAQVTLDATGEVSQFKPPKFLLLFSLNAVAWGGFTTAVDTDGKHHQVLAYTSYIRNGLYYDNFYIVLPRGWLETAAASETSLLFLGRTGELSATVPPVYPKALLHYIDSGAFRSDSPHPPATE